MGRGGPGKHLKVSGLNSRGLGKGSMCFLRSERGRKIAIECYTNCSIDHAVVIFFVAFSHV